MTFSFSLYAVPLQITQIAYFRSETGNLERVKNHWKIVRCIITNTRFS